jgi:hypothetical protein
MKPIDSEFTLEILTNRLAGKHLPALKFVAHSLELPLVIERWSNADFSLPATTRRHFAEILTEWV